MARNTVNQSHTTNNDRRSGSHIYPGTFLAEVMHNQDPQKAGRLWVYISEFGYDRKDPASWVVVSYASPFYGISPHERPNPQGQGQQQEAPVTTYGFWAIPPDVGVKVLCTFIEGNSTYGYWYAVVPTISHSMIPAMGAPDGKTPVMDVNPLSPKIPTTEDLDSLERQPYEPMSTQFSTQGIQEDPLRGPITSSSFRESPSRVFGISSQTTPTSPGHSFVMDDGDAEGKNKLIRIRSSSGNQITMHDESGMIYLINAQGTGWIELSPSGQIDVYGEAGINLATSKGDINLHAENNINLHANNCVKIVGMNGTKVMGGTELQLHGAKTMIEGVDSLHIHSCTEIMITSFADIHMKAFNYFCLKGKCFYWNSCTAKEAEQVPPEQPQDVSGYQTTVARAPNHEPYKEHDSGQSQGGQPSGEQGGADGGEGIIDTGADSLGNNFSLGFNTGLQGNSVDNAATSLGNNFNLSFKTGLSTNKIGTGSNNWGTGAGQTQSRDAVTAVTQPVTSASGASMGMSFNQSPLISNPGGGINPVTVDSTALNKAVRTDSIRNSNLSNISTSARTDASTQAVSGTTAQNTITTTNYTPAQSYGGYGGIPETTTPGSLAATTSATAGPNRGLAGLETTQTSTQQNAAQNPDVFSSRNPADQTLTGQTPAQQASTAFDQISGMSPSSDLPAAPGGGGTACFATGDNCQRPADETGGGGGGAGDPSGQGDVGLPTESQEGYVSQKEIYDGFIARGYSPDEARLMSAVAMAESGGNLTARNFVGADESYGLLQINMKGSLGPARMNQFGLTNKSQLFDLNTNLDAADRIYKTQGIRAWGAYTNGSYKKFY
jgi:hypothetical protein